ncbi:MAG: hypothetical protein EXR28_07275 [Betaproteobacteria bacterium]|nr:hypothetical protein [Betaproteobacteria bacterium]
MSASNVQRIGLDIDGTITADPQFFAGIAQRWLVAGREVHVVSSRSPEARPETLLELREFGISFTDLYLCPTDSEAWTLCPHTELDWYRRHLWLKVGYALAQGITHFVDNDPMVLDLFERYAPQVNAFSYENRHRLT